MPRLPPQPRASAQAEHPQLLVDLGVVQPAYGSAASERALVVHRPREACAGAGFTTQV